MCLLKILKKFLFVYFYSLPGVNYQLVQTFFLSSRWLKFNLFKVNASSLFSVLFLYLYLLPVDYMTSLYTQFSKLELGNCPDSSFFLTVHIQSLIISSYFYLLSLKMISSPSLLPLPQLKL